MNFHVSIYFGQFILGRKGHRDTIRQELWQEHQQGDQSGPLPLPFFWETQERKILVFTTKWDPLVRSWFIIAFIDKYRLSINSNDPIYTWYTPHKSKVLLLVVSHGPHMAGEGQGKRQRGQHRGAGDGTTGVRGHSGDLSTGTMGTSADFTRDIIMLNCDSIDLMNIV